MNRFFDRYGERSWRAPRRAYARLDQTEPMHLDEDAEEVVFAFEAVDAEWLSKQRAPCFHLHSESDLRGYWKAYWRGWFSGEPPVEFAEDPFEQTPIYRIELTWRKGDAGAEEIFSQFWKHESIGSPWFVAETNENGTEVDVFGGVFAAPTVERMQFAPADYHLASNLTAIFDMGLWPAATAAEITAALTINERPVEFLAVYDIGQGSANALLSNSRVPGLYYDLGCGVYRNARTKPNPLAFCWTAEPSVLLSHWDADHWGGAVADPNACARTWVVPRQSIGATHTAFANNILRAGGRIRVWDGLAPIAISLGRGQTALVFRCSGFGRNGSGLGMIVDDHRRSGRAWLLTGDAKYDEIPDDVRVPSNLAAVVVPHHGAEMRTRILPPRRPPGSYARLLYSFGPDNKHGRTNVRHPTAKTVAAHRAAGWSYGQWNLDAPGLTLAGADTLATAEHHLTHLGGAVVGWTEPPTLVPRPCGQHCSISIDQA